MALYIASLYAYKLLNLRNRISRYSLIEEITVLEGRIEEKNRLITENHFYGSQRICYEEKEFAETATELGKLYAERMESVGFADPDGFAVSLRMDSLPEYGILVSPVRFIRLNARERNDFQKGIEARLHPKGKQ